MTIKTLTIDKLVERLKTNRDKIASLTKYSSESMVCEDYDLSIAELEDLREGLRQVAYASTDEDTQEWARKRGNWRVEDIPRD